ncbi:ATP-grasp domain-containing protein [Streptomyces sp. NPDC002120]|uniref:ATP-grasp domain-containing protein n=1 Tax=Streptomyces sp. NPDC002120 TaxID=3364631 RepID=UPI0036983297
MGERPVILAIFDRGAAMPWEIVEAAQQYGDTVFVCRETSPHIPALLPLLRDFGETLLVSDATHALQLLGGRSVAGLLTFSDSTLLLGAELAEALGCRFHDRKVALALTDKLQQRECLRRGAVQVPALLALDSPEQLADAASSLGFPCIVKPRQSCESRHTYRVRDREACGLLEAALADAWSDVGGFIVEEIFVGDIGIAGSGWGDYVSVESLVVNGKIEHIAILGKFALIEPFRETGQFYPSTLGSTIREAVLGAAGQAIEAIGIQHGVCHTEVKLTAEGPRIIEVNGRLGGAVHPVIRHASGASMVEIVAAAAVGADDILPPLLKQAQTGPRMAYQIKCFTEGYGVVDEVLGLDRVQRQAGVISVSATKHRGDVVDRAMGSSSDVAHVYGLTENHHELRDCFNRVNATIYADFLE